MSLLLVAQEGASGSWVLDGGLHKGLFMGTVRGPSSVSAESRCSVPPVK